MHSNPHHILVAHLTGLTETILALPALRALRHHFERSAITIVSSAAGAEVLRLAGCAETILAGGRISGGEWSDPRGLYRSAQVCRELRRGRFDLSIEFEPGLENGILQRFAQPASRLAQRPTLNRGFGALIERIAAGLLKQPPPLIHLAHRYLKLLEPLGVRPIEALPRLATDRAADQRVDRLLDRHRLAGGELLVGIHTGAGAPRWPRERFASIAARMIHNLNALVVVFAGPRERGSAKTLAAALPAKRAIAIESPKLSDLISWAARLSVLVAPLHGPAHVAAAAGTPVVAASISTGPSPQDLLGEPHLHIRGPSAETISEEAIYEAACRLIKTNRAERLRAR